MDEIYKLKFSCRAALTNSVRMSNLCQSFEALIHDFNSGSIGNLENGVIIVVGLNRSHLLDCYQTKIYGGVQGDSIDEDYLVIGYVRVIACRMERNNVFVSPSFVRFLRRTFENSP